MSTGPAPIRVVVVGAGFGGLRVAKSLAGDERFRVTLLDRRNHHLFQPLLYQVATAGLSPSEIAVPARSVLAGSNNVDVRLAEVRGVDLAGRVVKSDQGEFSYDRLVLACGAQHSYFGHEEWEPFAPGLKTLEQATEIRRRILVAFEQAENEPDAGKRRFYQTFVVVGGGPTGVELAGTLGEINRYTVSRDYRRARSEDTSVYLVEAGARILPSFSEELAARGARDLAALGARVLARTLVTNVDARGVEVKDAAGAVSRIEAATVIWAAGVQPSLLGKALGVPLDRQGRVIVAADLSLPGHPEVFVIGDQAHFEDGPRVLPGVAPVAMQQGRHVATNLRLDREGRAREPFRYFDKGQMATVGRNRALVEMGDWKLVGWFAWVAWLFVHILYLIDFRNRLLVLTQWFWSYVTFHRGARLILSKEWRSFGKGDS